MLSRTLLAAGLVLAGCSLAEGELIGSWQFNGFDGDSLTIPADSGNGTLSIDTGWSVNSFTGTTQNALPGTPAGKDLALSNQTNNGRGLTLEFSTLNFFDPVLSFATRRSSTGFDWNTVSYSTDNDHFTVLDSYSPPASYGIRSFDLSSIDAVDHHPTVYLRLDFDGASSSSGNNRLDNLQISGTAASVPEPAGWIVAAGLFGIGAVRWLRTGGSRTPVRLCRIACSSSCDIGASRWLRGTGMRRTCASLPPIAERWAERSVGR